MSQQCADKAPLKSKLGFTLLELLLVVTIATLIILESTRYFSDVVVNSKITTVVEQVKALRQAANEWEETNADFTNINLASLNNMGLIPKSLSNGISPWNTGLQIQANPQNSQQLQIIIDGPFPAQACDALKNLLQSQATSVTPDNCGDVAKAHNFSNFVVTF